MGHKVHPVGFRIGVIRDWQAKWYADKHYAEFLQEDLKLRQAIQERYAEAAVSQVEIERQANRVSITIYTARPGIVIGRGGQRVDETRAHLEQLIGKKVQLNIQEIQRPELDAYLVAKTIAEQIERRVAFRRAMKQTMLRTMQAGAKGMKVSSAGRLGGAEIARRLTMHEGQVPLHTLRADIDYGFVEAKTAMGRIGVKVWIYKGDVLPEPKGGEVEEELIGAVAGAEPAVEEEVAEPVAEAVAEEAPVEEVTGVVAEEAPVEEVTEVVAEVTPTEEVAEPAAEEAPAEAAEEKPAKPAVKRTRKTATAKAKEAPAEAVEEKPAKPAAKRTRKTATAKAKEAPAEAVEEKPAKPATKRKRKTATAKAETTEPVAEEAPAEEEGESSAAT